MKWRPQTNSQSPARVASLSCAGHDEVFHLNVKLAWTPCYEDQLSDDCLELPRAWLLEETAHLGEQVVHAGDTLEAPKGKRVDFDLRVTAAVGGKIRWRQDGAEVARSDSSKVTSTDQTFSLPWVSDGQRHWFRAEVVGADGKTWLLGNPIYVNWTLSNPCLSR